MPRPALHVRPATEADLPALLAFGDELRDQVLPTGDGAGRTRTSAGATRLVLESRYREAIADPARCLVVVEDLHGAADEGPLGMAMMTVASANALLDIPAAHLSHAVVADRHRRRGAGRALVAAALSFAEEHGLEQLVVSVHPGSRDANRFFARLGFTPLVVRRSAPVAAVRRRMAVGEVRPVEHVVRRRTRRVVRMPRTTGLPLGPSTED